MGYYETLKAQGIITGTENYGGATATSGGLVFAAGTIDKLIRAFNSETGDEFWSYELPFIGSAPPSTYLYENKQYIVLHSSGGSTLKKGYPDLVKKGNILIAFKLKE